MNFFGDPGQWIVLALVGVVHLTVVLSRKFAGGFRIISLGVAVLPWLCCFGPVVLPSVRTSQITPWPVIVPMLCGCYLASRMSKSGLALLAAIGGMIVAGVLCSFIGGIAKDPSYMIGESRWDWTDPRSAVDELENLGNGAGGPLHPVSTKPAGYVSAWSHKIPAEYLFFPPDEFDLSVAIPLWHTGITGISGRVQHKYRLWTPGGNPTTMADGARLVNVDPGSTEETRKPPGKPLSEFPYWSSDTGYGWAY